MSKKVSKVVVHPYIPAMIILLEHWLAERATEGWQLINVQGFKFTFQSCQPYTAKFFAYSGFDSSKGISADYWMSKTRYARKDTQLNKGSLPIYEVDQQKIDADFSSYVRLRDKYYLKHYRLLCLFSLICILLSIVLFIINRALILFAFFWVFVLLYSCISIVILSLGIKQQK